MLDTGQSRSIGRLGDSIFLVHGRDCNTMEKIARFVEKIGIEVVILHENPDKGLTIIEKLEVCSGTRYAVVLLTADDRGGLKEVAVADQRLRARQNVVLELGYFIGKLGRDRVCVLYEEGVEIPSDYSGNLYISLDERGAWKLLLARELRAAGLHIDLNKAI